MNERAEHIGYDKNRWPIYKLGDVEISVNPRIAMTEEGFEVYFRQTSPFKREDMVIVSDGDISGRRLEDYVASQIFDKINAEEKRKAG